MPKAVQLTRAQIVAFLRSEMKREVPAEYDLTAPMNFVVHIDAILL